MTEMEAHNEGLSTQLGDKERKCHATEVTLSCAVYICAAGTICACV